MNIDQCKKNHLSMNCGELNLIIGPMFSGKTSFLLSKLTRYVDVGINSLYINSHLDTRSTDFSTHNSSLNQISSKILTVKVENLSQVNQKLIDDVQVIAVDESQFFSDLLTVIPQWMKLGKILFVAGLDGDYNQSTFGSILSLIPICSSVKKLLSVCELCKKDCIITSAPFTIRSKSSNELILIGGKDVYLPVCFSHLQLYKEI
jgi:thymidine kinase